MLQTSPYPQKDLGAPQGAFVQGKKIGAPENRAALSRIFIINFDKRSFLAMGTFTKIDVSWFTKENVFLLDFSKIFQLS